MHALDIVRGRHGACSGPDRGTKRETNNAVGGSVVIVSPTYRQGEAEYSDYSLWLSLLFRMASTVQMGCA